MQRKFLISAVLFLVGAAIYVYLSEGPFRVRSVTIPVQLIFLGSICYAAWKHGISRRSRILALIGIVAVSSVAATWIDSRVIMAFIPLRLAYFVTGFFAFLVEAILFLGFVSLIDWMLPRWNTSGGFTDQGGGR